MADLAPLDLVDDRQKQFVPGCEVVQQHPMAGVDGSRHFAQRAVPDAACGEFVD